MSLLMDALRKAEEAKSKVKENNEETEIPNKSGGSSEPSSKETSKLNSQPDHAQKSEESEILSNNDSEKINPLSLVEREEDATVQVQQPSNIENKQTQEPAPEKLKQAAHTEDKNVANKPTTKSANQKQKSSANSLFLAKKKSQQDKLRKSLFVLLLISILPISGGIYWYFSQQITTENQYMIPNGYDVSSRGFLGEGNISAEPLALEINSINSVVSDNSNIEQLESVENSIEINSIADTTGINSDLSLVNPLEPSTLTTSRAATNNQEPAQITQIENIVQNEVTNTSTNAGQINQVTPIESVIVSNPIGQAVMSNSGSQAIDIVRSESTSSINPLLLEAYNHYQRGNLVTAKQQYQTVLNEAPENRDATLGLAGIYTREGNSSSANTLYARILELNPRDPIARAGLASTTAITDPASRENELRSLINSFPQVSQLPFALGNLYASQNRWSEAQSAYFNALLVARQSGEEPLSPDYSFNLAVSLEQLNQLGPAFEYYQEASELSQAANPSFDRQVLNQRMQYLERVLR